MDEGGVMNTGAVFGDLEIRRGGNGTRRMRGSFGYGSRATMSAGGNGRRPRKEEFAPGAFDFAVDDPEREIHFLLGHSFDHPLASKKNGTLTFRDTPAALTFEATLTPEVQRTSWGQDFLAGYEAGLIVGVSPGFRIPPPEAVPDAERTIEEDPAEGNALIRVLQAVVLFEISAVTRPAYSETSIEERNLGQICTRFRPMQHASARWR